MLIKKGIKIMHYYATYNEYGDKSNIGFANTWHIIQFECKQHRDDFVDYMDRPDVKAISVRAMRSPIWSDIPIYEQDWPLDQLLH